MIVSPRGSLGSAMDDHWMSGGIMVPRVPFDDGMRALSLTKLLEAPSERNDVTLALLGSC